MRSLEDPLQSLKHDSKMVSKVELSYLKASEILTRIMSRALMVRYLENFRKAGFIKINSKFSAKANPNKFKAKILELLATGAFKSTFESEE